MFVDTTEGIRTQGNQPLTTTKPWEIVGCSRPTWHRLMADGKAPKPLDLLPGKNTWRIGDIADWVKSLKPATGYRSKKLPPNCRNKHQKEAASGS